jgi:broad specificity phosphatase PhoE
MKIIIIRHGKPDLPLRPRIAAGELGEWLDAYQRSGVNRSAPSEEALQAARECPVIVTSDLARSMGSAAVLPHTGRVISERLFREAEWPYSSVPILRLRPYTWAAVFRVLWFFGYRKNCREPVNSLKQRAALAADRLISLAHTHGAVLFVGHGILNTFIIKALRKKGWKGPRLPGYGFWAVSEYTK